MNRAALVVSLVLAFRGAFGGDEGGKAFLPATPTQEIRLEADAEDLLLTHTPSLPPLPAAPRPARPRGRRARNAWRPEGGSGCRGRRPLRPPLRARRPRDRWKGPPPARGAPGGLAG